MVLAPEIRRLQQAVNAGVPWLHTSHVASLDRMMAQVYRGNLLLPDSPVRNAWGNSVPTRFTVVPGSPGTVQYVADAHGADYADELDAITNTEVL